ncbi:MAG: enolase C-terminal domain-like protein [Gemmataceae bacterium]
MGHSEKGTKLLARPNFPDKSAITLAASLHVMAALPAADIVEFCMAESPLRHELTHERFEIRDGLVRLPEAPGLGVTVDPDVVARYRTA